MKIQLQSPFTSSYKSGYLLQNKEPRNLVVLIGYDNSRKTLSYARYLMSCYLNRFLLPEEHVDHIDGNKLNDTILNLQILSSKENNLKMREQNNIKITYFDLICPVCKKAFVRPAQRVSYKINKGKIPCCSRKYGGIYSHVS